MCSPFKAGSGASILPAQSTGIPARLLIENVQFILRLNKAVVAVLSPVEDINAIGLRIGKDQKVVLADPFA